MKISDSTNVQMPLKTVASLITLVAIGTWAYFGVVERLNKLETNGQLMQSDLEKNNEFRIKTPQSPTDKEQYMLIEHLSGQVEKIQTTIESMAHNAVNISRLQKDVEKAMQNIEHLKDSQRHLQYSNGK